MDNIETAQVVKRGETCIEAVFSRYGAGVLLRVKVHPIVEEYMKSLGDGTTQQVAAVAQGWTPPKNAAPLEYYNISKANASTGHTYSLTAIGDRLTLLDPNGGSKTTLNLSFLRLKGISEGTGLTFSVDVPTGIVDLRRLRDELQDTFRNLYINFIRPVDIGVVISNVEHQY